MGRPISQLITVEEPQAQHDQDAVPLDEAKRRLAAWGFQAHADLPDGPGPAFLLVALRPAPTLRHYDPDAVEYWATEKGRGARRLLSRRTPLPLTESFSWGPIRLVDRLGITNDYLTFGGRLDAAQIEDVVVAAFASAAPILRRGGHSQGWDEGADAVGAFFGRLMVQVDFTPGFESRLAGASPLARYAAFLRDARARCSTAGRSGSLEDELSHLMAAEAARLQVTAPDGWEAGGLLSPDDVWRPARRCP
jgi:hypothetical protein